MANQVVASSYIRSKKKDVSIESGKLFLAGTTFVSSKNPIRNRSTLPTTHETQDKFVSMISNPRQYTSQDRTTYLFLCFSSFTR
ncbi:hypothetical protein HanIR_Chr01g0017641 [Helianthus annuus]|nr:hypothetical protein HanIR_Chr01g0017641 [Helianthus annuus]